MDGVAGFRTGLPGPLESVRTDRANQLSFAGAGDNLCPAVGGGTGASETIVRTSAVDGLETALRPNAFPPMNLKLSRRYRRWLRTRDPRQLWWSIPALLAIASWMVLALCLTGWQPDEIEVGYSGIAKEALAARDFETARVAAQRLLAVGAGSRNNWLFHLALADAGLGRDREASALFNAVAPVDRPGYLHGHLFVAQALLTKTNVTAQDIKTAEQHLLHALSLAPSLS